MKLENFFKKYRLAFYTAPFILIVVGLKFLAHTFSLEFLELNALFTALISANIFLIGFLISGTLSDYKESERLPGDLANSIQAIFDEVYITYVNQKSPDTLAFLKSLLTFNQDIISWFHKKTKTGEIYDSLFSFNDQFLKMEPLTQANFIVRIKNEQNQMRSIITRIHTIRETSFLKTGYAVAEIITALLVIGLIFRNLNPYYESIFFVAFVCFIMIYMILFINDLDNPFSYYQKDGLVEEVSLKPLTDTEARLEKIIQEISEK